MNRAVDRTFIRFIDFHSIAFKINKEWLNCKIKYWNDWGARAKCWNISSDDILNVHRFTKCIQSVQQNKQDYKCEKSLRGKNLHAHLKLLVSEEQLYNYLFASHIHLASLNCFLNSLVVRNYYCFLVILWLVTCNNVADGNVVIFIWPHRGSVVSVVLCLKSDTVFLLSCLL